MTRVPELEKAGNDSFFPSAKSANHWGQDITGVPSEIDLKVSPEIRHFVMRFRDIYSIKRPECEMPPLQNEDYALLQRRMEQHPLAELEAWLPAFFDCTFGYVRRREWSLESYLESLAILQTASSRRK